MPTIRKRGAMYRVEIAKLGVRESRSFSTKSLAKAWATHRESEILTGALKPSQKPLGDALARYAKEVSPTKRGARWEALRLAKLGRDPIASVSLAKLSAPDIADWRDRSLLRIKPASVAREFNLLRSVLEVARREWRWIDRNPMQEVRKPSSSPPRQRRLSQDELDRLCLSLGYVEGEPENVSQRVALALLFAVETGMRAGEICGLTRDRLTTKTARLVNTKNGDAREVPLSPRAREILGLLGPDLFALKTSQIDALFRKARDRAGIEGLRFHDSRAEACTRLARKLDILELARVIGHRDPRSLSVYFRATASEIADKL